MESTGNFVVPESLAVSDSGFLFHASTGETFTLNPIGKEILAMVKEGHPLADVKKKILADYDIDGTTLERDMDDFITQLKHYKLVTER